MSRASFQDGSQSPYANAGKSLVIGLGNPILGDDGVGWQVADEVLTRLHDSGLEAVVERLSVGGLALMERMLGYERVIVADAVRVGESQAGSLFCLPLNAFPDHSTGHTTSAHDTSLQNALRAASELGFNVPSEVWVVGIQAEQTDRFSEELSPEVAAAIPEAADTVIRLILDGVGKVGHHDLT